MQYSRVIEVIGRVQPDQTVEALALADLSEDFGMMLSKETCYIAIVDMNLHEEVVKIAPRFPQVFGSYA